MLQGMFIDGICILYRFWVLYYIVSLPAGTCATIAMVSWQTTRKCHETQLHVPGSASSVPGSFLIVTSPYEEYAQKGSIGVGWANENSNERIKKVSHHTFFSCVALMPGTWLPEPNHATKCEKNQNVKNK